MLNILLTCFLLAICKDPFSNASGLPKAGCSISVNKHLGDPQPLLLLQNTAVKHIEAFPLPVDNKGTLTFSQGETIDLACPGSSVVVDGSNTGKLTVPAQCSSGITFLVQGKRVPFTALTCKKVPYDTARYNGKTCASKYKEIEIGFQINNRFIKHITSCFDDVLQSALYSYTDLSGSIGGGQGGYPRVSFKTGRFFDKTRDLKRKGNLSSRTEQRKTINKILGFAETDMRIIQENNDYFLSTGHYVPKADFVYGVQQRVTFYYVNTAPQWQTFNVGNWGTIEARTRRLAGDRRLDLQVYTGSHGISKHLDSKGVEQELYLWVGSDNEKKIPVPHLFYKVVYDPVSKAGVAFVGLNNPNKKIDSSDTICKDVCGKISWLELDQNDIKKGYSYCCEVDDLRRTITVLPRFQVTKLLL